MKAVLVTLFLLSISTSFALKANSAYQRQMAIHSLQLEKISSLGAALKGLISLAEVGEFAEVLEILQRIRQELSSIRDQTQTTLNTKTDQFETSKANYESTIAALTQAIADTEQSIAENEASQARLEAAIAANIQAINEAEASTTSEVTRRAQAEAGYLKHAQDVLNALGSLSEARAILEQIQAADLATVGVSFIQTHKRKLGKQLALVQETISNMNLKTSPMSYYLKELIQIAQDGEHVNADIFARIAALVEEFTQTLTQEREDTLQANDDDRVASESLLATLANTIAAQTDDLNNNQASHAAVVATLGSLRATLASLQSDLATNQNDLAALIAAWEVERATQEGYIARLDRDVDVLGRAEAYVSAQNVDEGLDG